MMSRTTKGISLLYIVGALVLGGHNAWAKTVVPMKQTSLSPVQLVAALREGHVRVFGSEPPTNRLAMAWGQVAFENGQGKYSYNHNLGNVGPTSDDQAVFKVGAGYYRDFLTFEDGAEAYWRTIRHCTAALVQFDAGLPQYAANALKKCKYFEAEVESYTKGLTSLFKTATTHVIPEEENERSVREESFARELAEAARPACDGACEDH